jgi:hypothetical protein
MGATNAQLPIGQLVSLPGHFDLPVTLESARPLGDTYWLYVVWDPLANPDPEPLIIQNPAKHLDHAKKEIVAARYFYIPAAAIELAAKKG